MTVEIRKLLKRRKTIMVAAILFASSAAIYGLVHLSHRSSTIPAFAVKREEFVDSVQFRGEVKAMKSLSISAPAEAGELQILKIANTGVDLKKGDLIVEFDKSKTEQELATDGSALKSAQAAIDQVRAQSRLTEEEDMTAVTKAQYDVEVAKLDASKQEIVSKIEGAEANLKVANSQQKLHEVEEKLKSDRAVIHANVDSKLDASRKAAYDLERAQRSLATMTLVAPSSGLVNLVSVWHVGNMAPFKPGERVWAGAPIAELPDVSTLRVSARVDEADRGRLAAHQSATVQLDAIPERQFSGKLEQIGTIATMDFSAGWPIPRDFNLQIALDQKDPRLKPGMTAQITVIVDRIPNAIAIPVRASFQRSGQTVAYVVDGSKYREQPIEVSRRSRDRILVSSGLRPGDRVALQDPLAKDSTVKE
jgi:RND family efflux transporter MFP subunit